MYVKSLQLDDVKSFADLSFDFERPDKSFAGWTVLVGGNSSGKSTVLKSIALALMGPESSRELLGSPSTWDGWIRKTQKRSSINLELSWDQSADGFRRTGANPGKQFESGVRFLLETKETDVAGQKPYPVLRPVYRETANRTKIRTPERGPWDPNARGWFSAGYGPMRRLTGSSSDSVRLSLGRGAVSRFVTLFREDAALSESETWLKTAHSRWLETQDSAQKDFLDNISEFLSDGLLPGGMKITRVTVDDVFISDPEGLELPMRDISDGCRGVYATVLDLVHGMSTVYGSTDLFKRDQNGRVIVDKPGVVLIDEIEAHLHPSWQRDIPEWFKSHFPKIQFLVTTHSPLVAQAADENGIFLLPSAKDINGKPRQLDAEEVNRLRLGRAEKTLLGVAFGLKTVRSTWANWQIEKWKKLNAKQKAGVPFAGGEQEEFLSLRPQMEVAFDQTIPVV